MDAVLFSTQNFISNLQPKQYSTQFKLQNQMIIIDQFLPEEYVKQTFIPELDGLTPFINRVNIPGFKKSGSVSSQILKAHAPQLYDLYHSDAVLNFVEQLVDLKLQRCPERDPHAVALYYYTEPGDRIGIHYDKSFYRGARYTVLLGLVQDSEESKLLCYPEGRKKSPSNTPLAVATTPGKLVIFNGNTLWHEVSPLGKNQKRVILTMEFLTDTRISFFNKIISDVKDRYLYFGKANSHTNN